MKWSLDFIQKAVGGQVLSSPHNKFQSYCTDSREPKISGSLFIALVGDSHNAHDFIPQAVEAGARGVLCHLWNDSWNPLKQKASFIQVPQTLKALQDLASSWRDELSAKIMAITGSNGKTTTKNFLYHILSKFGQSQMSPKNFNNHWGLPFSLLNSQTTDQFCILEMGMNHPGEITKLNLIARPHIVAVVNVGQAHIGNFTDGISGVARAKEEIYQSAPKDTLLVFNLDNPWTKKMAHNYNKNRSLYFSCQDPSAHVFLKIIQQSQRAFIIKGHIGEVKGQAEVSFWGQHNLENLTTAVTMALGAGIKQESLWQVLKESFSSPKASKESLEKMSFPVIWGRNQWLDLKSGGRLLFDGYNANPDSFKSLLQNLKRTWDQKKQYIALFGEMLELGYLSSTEHQKLGELTGELAWSHCVFIGPSGHFFERGWKSSNKKIKPIILKGYKQFLDRPTPFVLNGRTRVIVKGSRGSALEKLVEIMKPVNFFSKE